MTDTADLTESIFAATVALANAEERAAYIDQACRGDAALRAHVEALLRAHDRAGHLLDRAVPGGPERTGAYIPNARPGAVIAGRYKLLEAIGEGGMGTVWVAGQSDPVKRRVALKLIKPGMDTKPVLSRFEAERQALALMDHPNIAKVFDGGTTDEGRPFFVMEYVKGVPITEYCDNARLSIRDRLKLLVPVCQAVQHAHQKGVIHRDLKPSNILVCLYDGQPVPKVIDFGLAKAINSPLTEHTLYTVHGLMVGTPLYMSPEQAEFNNLDIDTRTDVYSLGVIMYELLTGTTPLEKWQFKDAAFQEILRLIKEVEPPKPSDKVSTSTSLPSIAAQRSLEPAQLSRVVRGELDWIVMKCLEKERGQRYESANVLAADLQRYLQDEPVLACPPSPGYRLRKFIKKHRARVLPVSMLILLLVGGAFGATVLTILLVVFLLVGGIIGTSIGMMRAMHAEAVAKEQRNKAQVAATASRRAMEIAQSREAETTAVLDFVEKRILAAARPEGLDGGLGWEVTLRQAVEAALPLVDQTFTNQPLIEARLRLTLGTSFLYLGETPIAAGQLETARALYAHHRGPDDPDTLRTIDVLARSYFYLGRHAEAVKLHEETLVLRKAKLGTDHVDTIKSMHALASSYSAAGRHTEELQLREDAVALSTTMLGREHPQTIGSMTMLGNTYADLGRFAEALHLHEATLPLFIAKLGPHHPSTLAARDALARSHSWLGQHAEAVKLHEENLALNKAKLGPDHPHTLNSMANLSRSYYGLGRRAEALKLAEKTMALAKAKLGNNHPDTSSSRLNVAIGYGALGRHDEARQLYEETLALVKAKLGTDHPRTLLSMNRLANCYANLGRHIEALKLNEETLALRKTKLGADHPYTLMSMMSVANNYSDLGRHHEARLLHEKTLGLFTTKLGPMHPDTLECMNNLAYSYAGLDRHADALRLRQKTLALRMTKLGSDHPDTLKTMWGVVDSLLRLDRGTESVPVIDECVQRSAGKVVDPHMIPALFDIRLRHFERIRDVSGCRATAEMWEKLNRGDGDSLYTSARMRAVTAAVIRVTDRSEAATKDATAEGDLAMDWLQKAFAAGYSKAAPIAKDDDLDALHGRDDFQKLQAELEAGRK